jgi:hypothetical protein
MNKRKQRNTPHALLAAQANGSVLYEYLKRFLLNMLDN